MLKRIAMFGLKLDRDRFFLTLFFVSDQIFSKSDTKSFFPSVDFQN